MIHRVAMRERPNMRIQQKALAVLQETVGILQVGLTLADRLHLGAAQRQSRFKTVSQEVVVARRAVYRRISQPRRNRITVLRLRGCGLRLIGGCRIGKRTRHESSTLTCAQPPPHPLEDKASNPSDVNIILSNSNAAQAAKSRNDPKAAPARQKESIAPECYTHPSARAWKAMPHGQRPPRWQYRG